MCTRSGICFSGSGYLKKNERTTQKRNYLCAQSVESGSQFRWLEVTWEFSERTHTRERAFKCTKCDNRFSSSSNLENYKRTPTVGKLWVHNVWHELLIRIWWIEETWRDHIGERQSAESVARASQSQVAWRNTREPSTGEISWEDSHRREGIQVHQMWQYFSLSNNSKNQKSTLTVEKLRVHTRSGMSWSDDLLLFKIH